MSSTGSLWNVKNKKTEKDFFLDILKVFTVSLLLKL